MTEFFNKSVLITGAASGIGRAAAFAFARQGARVALLDRDDGELAALIDELEGSAKELLKLHADIADPSGVLTAFDVLRSKFGKLDVAVNSAGIRQPGALTAHIDEDIWDRILQINLTGTWRCMKEQLKLMTPNATGTIVNVASYAGANAIPLQSAYVASKHAVLGLTKNSAAEYAPNGIRINAVCPGPVETNMIEHRFAGLTCEERQAQLEALGSVIPMRRVASATEISNAILFLSSAQSSFVTGECLFVDGGWNAL